MDPSELDYPLPTEAIAQLPVEPRDMARLLVDRGAGRPPDHRIVADLPDLLRPGDALIVNDTRVRAARLQLRRPNGGLAEVLLLEPLDGEHLDWDALVRPSRRLPPGTVLASGDGTLAVEVGESLGEGRRRVSIVRGEPDEHGEVPLPPYITAALDDPERYQTVYARRPASAAAPTAGLHLTEGVLERCRGREVTIGAIELVVGVDTFRPITADRVEDHPIHTERYRIPPSTVELVEAARRVVAVGTTSVRALESWARTGRTEGRTDLFLRRGDRFLVVDGLLTNFHVPRSTLIALVDAFVGPRWRQLYELALAEGYRFLSFGDAMLLQRGVGT